MVLAGHPSIFSFGGNACGSRQPGGVTLARASRPIEHPGRNLQPSPGCPTREAATENLTASLLNHLMNMDQAAGLRMPRIKKLVLRDPVGVPSSCCTTTSERMDHWIRMRRSLARFSGLESSVHTQYSADFIITTSAFRFSVHTPPRHHKHCSSGCCAQNSVICNCRGSPFTIVLFRLRRAIAGVTPDLSVEPDHGRGHQGGQAGSCSISLNLGLTLI